MDDASSLWSFLPLGFLISILIETPVLLVGLSSRHSFFRRFISGIWLIACTYPIVVLTLPIVFQFGQSDARYWVYLVVAEIFAPIAECTLFGLAFHKGDSWNDPAHRRSRLRDYIAITIANLASFGLGMLIIVQTISP